MYRHVIWDMGGTLVDTYPQLNAAFAGVVAAHGETVEVAEVSRLTHESTGHAIATLAARFGIAEAKFEDANAQLKRHWEVDPPPVMTGAHELMADISQRGGLNLVATHRDRRSATSLLDNLDLRVDDLVCPGDGYPRKPDPGMLDELVTRHGLRRRECLAVGDRDLDIRAAHAAGIAGAFLKTSGSSGANGTEGRGGAEYPVTSLAELRPILGLGS